MNCLVYDFDTLKEYAFVVIFTRYQNKWVLCKHRQRTTVENPGGHIEPGETPLEAAKRELYEETGALDFSIFPVCDYLVLAGPDSAGRVSQSRGQVFLAYADTFGPLPESEMERIDFYETYPDNQTYPDIVRKLFPHVTGKMKSPDVPAKTFFHNKLVRDRIIDIINAKGDDPSFSVLDDEKYLNALNNKLIEEVYEFTEKNDIEELADMMEVIYAIAKTRNISLEQAEAIRLEKREARGGFDKRLYLTQVVEHPKT